MANGFEVGVDVAVPPDAAWALAGDPARAGEWFAPVVACEVTGDVRRAAMGNGAVLVERLIDRDEAGRSYSDTVIEGVPGLTRHRATVRVVEAPGGARVPWRQTATPEVGGATTSRPGSGRSCPPGSRACAPASRAPRRRHPERRRRASPTA